LPASPRNRATQIWFSERPWRFASSLPEHSLQEVFSLAESLSAAHSACLGARSLEVLHVAAALLLEADEFVSFDRRQRWLAARAGLKVRPRSLPVAVRKP
jgi:hypothetical protein